MKLIVKRAAFVVTAAIVVSAVLPVGSQAQFTAYNDLVYSANPVHVHPPLNPNVTTYNIGNTSPGPTSGLLKDFNTGLPTSVTASLTQSGGVVWQPEGAAPNYFGGADTNIGTDAYSVFNPATASLIGVVYYGSTGWYVDLTLSGLNPAYEYEFVTSANRNRLDGAYDGRVTRWNLSGADSFVNTSTPGVTITSGGATVRFNTGNNFANGYVARWDKIKPGADGTILIRASAGGDINQAYAFSAFRLTEVVPEPGSMAVLAMGLAAFARKTFKR